MSFFYRGASFVPIQLKEECMKHKRFVSVTILSILLLTVLTIPASAFTVSVLVVETGLNEETPSTRYSSLWEGGLMETLFNAGHIVTNSPITRMEKKPSQDLTGMVRADFNEASSGGVEYFILGFLDHLVKEGEATPTDMTLKIYRTDVAELVFQQVFPARKGKNMDEEYQFAQDAGWTIISHIKEM